MGIVFGLIGLFILVYYLTYDPTDFRTSRWNASDIRGRGWWKPNRIQVGEPPWDKCEKHGKYYDKKTGKEVKIVTMRLDEFMEKYGKKHPCCDKDHE